MAQRDNDSTPMTPQCDLHSAATFETDLAKHAPFLRNFAQSLSAKPDLAEDLAQEALARAWQSRRSFTLGTNLKAWLCTILRNEYYSHQRRAWRRIPWDAALGETIAAPPREQEWSVEFADMARAMHGLPAPQREALILVGAGGFSYGDAARLSRCAVGTVKSRVARARRTLRRILDGRVMLPIKSRTPTGSAMDEVIAQLNHLAPDGAGRGAAGMTIE
jgi:RNA polymerase sigma-70 factor, ECF subfamily